jgi:hypothetical protein
VLAELDYEVVGWQTATTGKSPQRGRRILDDDRDATILLAAEADTIGEHLDAGHDWV